MGSTLPCNEGDKLEFKQFKNSFWNVKVRILMRRFFLELLMNFWWWFLIPVSKQPNGKNLFMQYFIENHWKTLLKFWNHCQNLVRAHQTQKKCRKSLSLSRVYVLLFGLPHVEPGHCCDCTNKSLHVISNYKHTVAIYHLLTQYTQAGLGTGHNGRSKF